jgi:hypothetical protein
MEPAKPTQDANDMKVVLYNLLVLLLYTVVAKATHGLFLLDAFFIVVHAVACLVIFDQQRRRVWQLSALMVVIIGFSTCSTFLTS